MWSQGEQGGLSTMSDPTLWVSGEDREQMTPPQPEAVGWGHNYTSSSRLFAAPLVVTRKIRFPKGFVLTGSFYRSRLCPNVD